MKEIHCTDCGVLMVRLIKMDKQTDTKSTLLCTPCAETRRLQKKLAK